MVAEKKRVDQRMSIKTRKMHSQFARSSPHPNPTLSPHGFAASFDWVGRKVRPPVKQEEDEKKTNTREKGGAAHPSHLIVIKDINHSACMRAHQPGAGWGLAQREKNRVAQHTGSLGKRRAAAFTATWEAHLARCPPTRSSEGASRASGTAVESAGASVGRCRRGSPSEWQPRRVHPPHPRVGKSHRRGQQLRWKLPRWGEPQGHVAGSREGGQPKQSRERSTNAARVMLERKGLHG